MGARLALALAIAASITAQESLQLKDGRFVVDKRIEAHPAGAVIHYDNGDVIVPRDAILACTAFDVDAKEAAYPPEDQAKIEQGLVPFEGRWMKPERRDAILQERRETRQARIEEAKKHRFWRNHYDLETKNFHFEYTIDPEVMQRYADMLEVYYKTFTKEWGIKKPRGFDRLKVCFYHDETTYYQVSGAPQGAIGYFKFVQPIELNFFYERLDEALTQDVLFHEANHFLTYLIDPEFFYPIWVNESLAEYYGASEWDEDKQEMIIGGLQEGRLAVLQDAIRRDELQDLEELMRLPQGQFNATHYAWGWSFVHFLMSDKKSEKAFKKFFLALARDSKIDRVQHFSRIKTVEPDVAIDVFKRIMKVDDLAALQAGWHTYVRGMRAASADGYRKAGDMALARGLPLKAQRYYRTALEMGDTNCMTHFGYGRALYQKSKHAEAAEEFEKAIAIDPLQGRFWMYLADAKNHQHTAQPEVDRLRRLALEIDPDDYSLMLRLIAGGKEEVK